MEYDGDSRGQSPPAISVAPELPRPMSLHDVPESDWKVFRELEQRALERFCKRTLEEVQTILGHSSRSYHNRCLDVFRLLQTRDDESRACIQRRATQPYDHPARCNSLVRAP